ncbi:MAG: HNH endonuclease [Acidimicrobiales bacterium]|nr:HNH endonuclease [Acidimicrobiales bacterium]
MEFTTNHAAAISAQLHTVATLDPNAQVLALTSVISELTARRDTLVARGTVEGTDRPLSAAWLIRNSKLGGHTANRIMNHSRVYSLFPSVAEAVTTGSITADHVGVLARLLPRSATAHRTAVVSESIGELLELAKQTSVKEFGSKCGEYVQICNETDPDVSGPDPTKFGVTAADNGDGTTTISLTLDTLRARVFLSAIEAVVDALSKADKAAAKQSEPDPQGDPFGADAEASAPELSDEELIDNWSFGDPMPAFGSRTRGQRIGNALALMGRAAVTVPEGADLVPETIVNITMDWDTFNSGVAALSDSDNHNPKDLDKVLANPHYRSRTIEGVPIPRTQVLMAAIMSRVRRVVFGSTSRKVDVGRTQRLFTDAARIGLLIKYGGCSQCGRSSGKIEIDHITDWALGGATDSANGSPKCWDCQDKTAQTHPDAIKKYPKAA